jgi:ABC-type transport system substrate-binding protein
VLVLVGAVIPSAAQERVLRMALPEGEVVSLDPHGFCCRGYQQVFYQGGDIGVVNIFDGLVRYDPHTLQPAGARESWDISADGWSIRSICATLFAMAGSPPTMSSIRSSSPTPGDYPDGIMQPH